MTMDEERARALLALIGERLGPDVVLWRGAHTDGSDIDVVALPDAEARLPLLLAQAGLDRGPGGAWRRPDGGVVVDVIAAHDWPPWYPPLTGVVARAISSPGVPALASAADRLLIFAADAVSGRGLEKLAARARHLLAQDGVRAELAALGESLGERSLAQLIADPDTLLAWAVQGRLPYRRALGVATRSSYARAALIRRVRNAARRRVASAWLRGRSPAHD